MSQEKDQRLGGALQENILTLLVFDDANCKLVRAAVTPQLFESSVYREIAGHAIDFIDQYGEAVKEHLPDHMEEILQGDDQRKASHYKRALDNLFLSRESINSTYVISQLQQFVRRQRFKSALVEAVEALDQNDDIDRAESIMEKGMAAQVVAFDPGLRLDNAEDVGKILDSPEEEGFTLGIPEFDDNGIMPRRKEVLGFVAARGKGKSWFATHCTKRALLQRWTPVVISLEMSEARYGARFLQSFFSISRRAAKVRITRIEAGRDGKLEDILQEEVERQSMQDSDIRSSLVGRAKREFGKRRPFRIKGFPSGSLNMNMLKAYIEGLIRFEKIHPDLIVVDYPRLFDLDAKNLRLELGKVNVDLRGLASELNCAVVILAQGNREAETALLVTGDMVEEDISFKATCDVVITYSQTAAEASLGLARLYADKVRNDESGILVLITQAYAIGQFCLDSIRLGRDYWDLLKSKVRGGRNATAGEEGGEPEAQETPRRRRADNEDTGRRGRRRTD